MSPAIDLSLTDNEFTPTPPSSTTVPTTTSDPTNDSEAAPFVSLIEQLRRAKAALPGDEHDKVIGSTASSRSPREICDITSGASTEESAEGYGGFGQEVKLIESKRSGVMPDVQGLALTFDAIPERVMSLSYTLNPPPRPILRSSISSETSETSAAMSADRGDAASIASSFSSDRPKNKRTSSSSRVRFSDELLPSANSSPMLMALRSGGSGCGSGSGQAGGSVDSIMLPPVREGETANPSLKVASPVSPGVAVRKAKMLRQRASTTSLQQYSSRRSSGASLSSAECMTSPSRSRFSGEDMFKPMPLPYRKLEKVLARLSVESDQSGITGSSASSIKGARDSLSSEPSSSAHPRRRRSTPSSLRSSLVDSNSAVGRGSVFSVKTDESYSRPVSPLELFHGITGNAVPAINRQDFADAFLVSPRSLPTPVAPDMSMFAESAPVPDYPPPDIPLPPPPSDVPIIDHKPERASVSSFSSLQVHKGHHREGSDASIEMVFPLPPKRLSVTVDGVIPESVALPVEPAAIPSEIAELDEGDEADSEDIARPMSLKETRDFVEEDGKQAGSSVRPVSVADSVTTSCEEERKSRPTSRRTSKGGLRSPSPEVSDVMAQAIEMLRRRKSSVYPLANIEDDSDIDMAAPLEEVALKSRILSPNSRLLRSNTTRTSTSTSPSTRSDTRRASSTSIASLRSGLGLTSGKGWSGSESEEEEWSSTSRLQVRRVRKTISSAFRPPPLRPTWAKSVDRLSSQSTDTTCTVDSDFSAASTANTALMTPSTSMESGPDALPGMGLGNVADDRAMSVRRISSEIGSGKSRFGWRPLAQGVGAAADISAGAATLKTRRASSSATILPTPTRSVEDWGAPEKMMDESDHELPLPSPQSRLLTGIKRHSAATKSLSHLPRIVPDEGEDSTSLSARPSSTSSSKVTTPIKNYFYTSTADLSSNIPTVPGLAAMISRASFPFPRVVSEPTKLQQDAAKSDKMPRIAARNSHLQLKTRSVGRGLEEEQCAACRFF